ncbi:ABC transporter ATP-binding protein [Merismopedia glauca]|uniref:ABC-type quaternary amine transporter n=1 Tax=Merismopedia glauca CCAP 1448/3 TaxID=1296344 RepID=A0A2T1C9V9_9CYAN|nr:ABC transporter ATP-binding protein [Merismopedia glauca]PSB05031.1 ABC transporter ATP-binding protein [Merismopedia glauca CCAP 1448/3]
MNITPILELEGVTKSFSAEQVPAVADLSLSVPPGDILGLLGPSGCGKTTLLRLIAGFERPNLGKIQIGGQVVASESKWIPPEQRQLGMVFQDYALFPHLTVLENIGFGLQNIGKVEANQRITEAIALVGLKGLEKRYPYELSGGQQQRVALARALAPRPKLILLDEALSNLDRQVRDRLREEVRHILKSAGISAVFVTHDQQEALAISDLVAVMRQGHLEQWGTPESIYTKPASRFVASFVTQANFLAAKRLSADLWETEIGCFELPQNYVNGDTGELMIRQEDLILKADPEGKVRICDRQFLGREYRYCLQTSSGKELHALTDKETDLSIGTPVQLYLTRQQPQIFMEM